MDPFYKEVERQQQEMKERLWRREINQAMAEALRQRSIEHESIKFLVTRRILCLQPICFN